MDTTELDNVQELLDRVRPDPAGFAQRLLMQVMTRWGDMRAPDPTTFYTQPMVQETLRDRTTEPSDASLRPAPYDGLVDTNIILAAALGACHCWGLLTDCETCRGLGTPGWELPDRELFTELVEPAVARMSAAAADGAKPRHDGDNLRTAQE